MFQTTNQVTICNYIPIEIIPIIHQNSPIEAPETRPAWVGTLWSKLPSGAIPRRFFASPRRPVEVASRGRIFWYLN
jgi:hypothetical protein